jgi:hypothetical protein
VTNDLHVGFGHLVLRIAKGGTKSALIRINVATVLLVAMAAVFLQAIPASEFQAILVDFALALRL